MTDNWDLNMPLLQLSDSDYWTLKDAVNGVQIFGGTGSGKTSGSGQTLAKTYLSNGFGGLVLTVKPNEADEWLKWASECGRQKSVILVRPDFDMVFNFLDYELNREYGGETENVLDIFMRVVEIVQQSDLSSGDNAFFYLAAQQLLRNAIDLCKMATGTVSIPAVYEMVVTAPTTLKERDSEEWQAKSKCFQYLKIINEKYKDTENYDLDAVGAYFLTEYPHFGDRLRSSINTIFTAAADPFLRGKLRKMFSTDGTEESFHLDPLHTLKGGIIIFDYSIKRYGLVGRVAQSLFKLMFQQAMERRDVNTDGGRPVFLWADENQNFINSYDVEFQQTARSSRMLTVYLTQNISNYNVSLGQGEHGKEQATSILGNLATKIFHANADPKTNQWASSIFGMDWMEEETESFSKNARETEFDGMSVSHSVRETERKVIEEKYFTELKSGGDENGLIVDSIVHQAGRTWNLSGANFLPVKWHQDFEWQPLK